MANPKPDELHPMVSIWSGTETRESIVCNSCSPTDAKLIVRAVNHHDSLVAICKEIADCGCDLGDSERRVRLYSALDKAGEL